jgi:hypothetical protein
VCPSRTRRRNAKQPPPDHFRDIRGRADTYGLLAEHNPELNFSVECVGRRNDSVIPIWDPRWQAADPALSTGEVQLLENYAREAEVRVRQGAMPGPDCYYPAPVLTAADQIDFIRRCHAHLRRCSSRG